MTKKTNAFLLACLLSMAACGGTTDTVTDIDDDDDDFQEEVSPIASCPPADTGACPAGTVAEGTGCVLTGDDLVTVNGVVNDFQTDSPVPGAVVTVLDNATGKSTGACGITDSAGKITYKAPRGTKIGLATHEDDQKDTYQFNVQYPAVPTTDTSVTTFDDSLISVSKLTAQLIPGIATVQIDPTKAIVAGTVYKSDGSKAVDYEDVVMHVSAGGVEANYFSDNDLPAPKTSVESLNPSNGLFVLFNLPTGAQTIEFTFAGEVSATTDNTLVSFPDSVAISNITCVDCN